MNYNDISFISFDPALHSIDCNREQRERRCEVVGEGKPRDPATKLGGIVRILISWAEIEDSEVFAVLCLHNFPLSSRPMC